MENHMPLIGYIIVLVSVLGGFTIAGGNVILIIQPAEFIVIVGAAVGSLVTMVSKDTLKSIIKSFIGAFKGGGAVEQDYKDMLKMFYDLFVLAQKDGIISLERHVEHPDQSEILNKNKILMKSSFHMSFLCDTMKLILSGMSESEIEPMLDTDIEVYEEERKEVSSRLNTVSEAFPGLGIVAAVLGVIITMKSINQGAEAVGEHIAAALVGTFLGILFCYGFIGPIATNIESKIEKELSYIKTMKTCMIAFIKGNAPILSVEMGRRSIPPELRPEFEELQNYVKGKTT